MTLQIIFSVFLGFPEHISFNEFCRRYNSILPSDCIDASMDKKTTVEMVLYSQGVEKNSYRMGLSQTFFRAGMLTSLDRVMEERLHGTMVLFQVCKLSLSLSLSLSLPSFILLFHL